MTSPIHIGEVVGSVRTLFTRGPPRLVPKRCALAIIDVQEKLFAAMPNREALLLHLTQIIRGAKVLELPIIWAEQYPKGMGPTITAVAELLAPQEPIAKRSFSLFGHPELAEQIKSCGRKHFLLAGIETHVCIYQTAADLLEMNYEVEIVADACDSRTAENRRIGLDRISRAGGTITSVETALFELLQVAEGPAFKEILKIIR